MRAAGRAAPALGLAVLAAGGCHEAAVVTTRTVTAYVPAACAADGGAYAEYAAYGDFDPPSPPETGHLLSDVGVALPEVYGATRALVVTASENGGSWAGVAGVAPGGDVDVLVLPALASCALSTAAGARSGALVAPFGQDEALVVGGAGNPVPATYVVDLDTGAVASVAGPDLKTPRTNASATAFGTGAVVAGGVYDNQVQQDAEVYSASPGGFDGSQGIQLSGPRSHHGAVVMASGQTLLVGGLGSTDATDVLASMEILEPGSPQGVTAHVEQLQFPRRDPTVLRLADGTIVVAGGFDGTGAPEQEIEWFEPDASAQFVAPLGLAQGPGSAFAALEGGGFLAVLMPPAGAGQPFANVYVVGATGASEPATAFPGNVTAPVLFGGAGGAPVLWTGSEWLQWQPYAGAFGPLGVVGGAAVPAEAPVASPDPGLAAWLDPSSGALSLLRFDTRNAYSALPGALLDADMAQTSPDRLSDVGFDPEKGLKLEPGTPGPAVFVTDRTYLDVSIAVTAPGGALAQVALRDADGQEVDVGGDECPLAGVAPGPVTLTVTRRGASVGWSTDGGASGTCLASFASDVRIAVGLRGQTSAESVVRDLVVTRLGEP